MADVAESQFRVQIQLRRSSSPAKDHTMSREKYAPREGGKTKTGEEVQEMRSRVPTRLSAGCAAG